MESSPISQAINGESPRGDSSIHYGYVGKAVGFTADELLRGAGLAQFGDDARRDIKHGKWPSPQNHPSNGPWPKSADDIQDQTSIRLGIDLWSDAKPGALAVDVLLERIAAVPVPWGDAVEGANAARCPVQIDIGFGDAVVPGPEEAQYPVILDGMPSPQLRVYPRYAVVAEKWKR